MDDQELTAKIKAAHGRLKRTLDTLRPAQQKCDEDKKSVAALYEKIRADISGDESTKDKHSKIPRNAPKFSPTKLSNYHRSKLKTAYNNALKNLGAETAFLRQCAMCAHEIRALRDEKRRLIFRKQAVSQQNFNLGGSSHNFNNVEGGNQKNQTGLNSNFHRSQTLPASLSNISGGGSGYGGLRRGALMMLLQKAATTLPLWVPDDVEKVEEDENLAPALCGAIPADSDHTCKPGDMVAVRAKVQDGDENWILAEVKNYDASTGKYAVEDIDEEQKEHYVISRKKLIPLPYYRAHPKLNPSALFDVNAVVWALYPQTTCFYKGVVERRPAGPNDQYFVAFEDSSYPTGYSPPLGVPQRYVIAQY